MSALLLPNEILSMSAQAARRLVQAGDGDAALLYLALLEGGGAAEKAREKLGWDRVREERAWQRLAQLELAQPRGPESAAPEPEPAPQRPEYSRKDLADALEREPDFQGLYREVERIVSRPLTDNDLKCLYTIYDYLALPPEVILLLAGHVARRERQRKPGGQRLRLPQIQKEAFRWKRLGVDTVEQAEVYLRRQELVDQREWQILSAIGVSTPRPAVEQERAYIERWVELGLSDELIALAYARTVYQKKEMSWPYMNRILLSWHQAGYTTAQQVEREDRPPQRGQGGKKRAGEETFQPSAERIRKNADWLDQFLQQQGEGG